MAWMGICSCQTALNFKGTHQEQSEAVMLKAVAAEVGNRKENPRTNPPTPYPYPYNPYS